MVHACGSVKVGIKNSIVINIFFIILLVSLQLFSHNSM